jgi:hypothetical protein
MSANKLLLWMSARGEGSWQQFRAAVEELHFEQSESEAQSIGDDDFGDLPLYQILRLNLQRLGHAEFFAGAGGKDWRVTPPSLAATGTDGAWRGILAGARSPKLLGRVCAAVPASQLKIIPCPSWPDQVAVHAADLAELAAIAQRAQLLFQPHAPTAILASLPAIDDPAVRRIAELPIGADWNIERFSTSVRGWRPSSRNDADSTRGALFRFSFGYRRLVLFCSRGRAYQIPAQVGKYLALKIRRRRVLTYEESTRQLSMPASCRPPFLIERALILCSGSPPILDPMSTRLSYGEVTRPIADLTFTLLRQERA